MPTFPYLERHGGAWRFRARIPRDLVTRCGSVDLRLQIGPARGSAAALVARALRASADRLFERLRSMTDQTDIDEALRRWKKRQAAAIARSLVHGGMAYLDPPPASDDKLAQQAVRGVYELDLLMRTMSEIDGPQPIDLSAALNGDPVRHRQLTRQSIQIVADLAAAGEISLPQDATTAARLKMAAMRAATEFSAIRRLLHRGDQETLNWALEPDASEREVDRSSTTPRPTSEPATPNVEARLFSAAFEAYIRDVIDVTKIAARSRRPELQSAMRVFVWIVGDRPVDTYRSRDLHRFRQVYLTLHRDYSRRPHYSRSAPDAFVDKTEKSRVSAKTFNKILSTLRAFFTWVRAAESVDIDVEGLFSRLHVKLGRRNSRDDRDAYTRAQVVQLLSGPLHTGCATLRSRSKAGRLVVRDALYWVPLIAAYSGMRREEICQLRVRHVAVADGVHYFDLNAADVVVKAGTAANTSSRRWVPLHRDLLELGFLVSCVDDRPPGDLLFPELTQDAQHDAYGTKLGKQFSRYGRAIGAIPEDQEAGFHRFRHFVRTALGNSDVKDSWIDYLMGHESTARSGEGARYFKKVHLKQLSDAIDKIEIDIDIGLLTRAASASPHLRRNE